MVILSRRFKVMGAEIKDDRYPWVGENHVVFSEANRNVSVLQWLFLTAKITERRHKGCKAGGASTTLILIIYKEN